MSVRKAVVVGGGFAGLTAGYYLRAAGWTVTLFEASDEIGGRVRTVRKGGYIMDTGATQMSTGYREYLDLCDAVGLRDQIVQSCQNLSFLRGGRLRVIDGRNSLSAMFSSFLSVGAKFKLLNALQDAKKIQPPINIYDVSLSHAADIESASDYCARRLSPELYEYLVNPIIRTYVMNRGDKVSALEFFSALENLNGETLVSINGGNDRLPKALAADLDVQRGVRVTRVDDSGPSVIVETDAGAVISADAVILATRLPEACAVYPALRKTADVLARDLQYNRAWVVQLGYSKRPSKDVVGVLLPENESPDVGLFWCEHAKNPDRAPHGHALFTLYSDESTNDAMLGRSDEELVSMGVAFVDKLFPELRGALDISHVTRWPMAIPNTAPGIYKKMAAMKAQLAPASRVQIAGDYLTCTGQNSAIYWGKQAAKNVLKHHATATAAAFAAE